jgi:hypothetical protein
LDGEANAFASVPLKSFFPDFSSKNVRQHFRALSASTVSLVVSADAARLFSPDVHASSTQLVVSNGTVEAVQFDDVRINVVHFFEVTSYEPSSVALCAVQRLRRTTSGTSSRTRSRCSGYSERTFVRPDARFIFC